MNDNVQRLLDRIALQDERSRVDGALRARIRQVVLDGKEDEPLERTAYHIAHALTRVELADLVADWLDTQEAI